MKQILFFLLLPLWSLGQTPITLSEAIEIGLKNNYQIKIAERQVDIAKNNNTLKATGRYPVIDFNLNSTNSVSRTNNPASFIPEVTNVTAGLTPSVDLQWTIFNGYKFKINKQRFEELELQGQGQVKIAVENTIQAITSAYYAAIIQKEQLTVLQKVLDLSRDRIKYQEVRQEFGQAGKFDILQSTDAYLNDSTRLLLQQNNYNTALLNLKLAMGDNDPNTNYEPTDKITQSPDNYVFEDLEKKLLASNHNLRQLQIAQKLSQTNADMQASNRYPTITLGSGVSFRESVFWQSGKNPFTMEDFGSDFSNNLNYYLNASLTYRLYDAGARKRANQNAAIEVDIAALNIKNLEQQLSSQLKIAVANYNNQLQLFQLTERIMVNAEENIKIANERFKGGQISSFDYRAIQLSYVNASQSRLNALFNLKNTEITLVKLTGGMIR